MALMKELGIGDEMVFDLTGMDPLAKKEISVILTYLSMTGKRVEFKLTAHPSIKFKFFKQVRMSDHHKEDRMNTGQ
jgi:hypothetical protein